MSVTNPVRYPDAKDQKLMTKRAWWLVLLNIFIPGSAQLLAGNRRLGRFGLGCTLVLWGLAVVAIALLVFARALFVTVSTHAITLWAVQLGLVFYAVLWVVLTFDALRLVRLVKVQPSARAFVAGLSLVALAALAGTAAYGSAIAGSARALLGEVFADGEVAEPVDGRYNILLLGGDAGPDRVGLRPDSIAVISIDAGTGKAVRIGIPRNLEFAPFAEGSPLWNEFPDGYSCGSECLISYLYTYGSEHPELYPDAEAAGRNPGVQATMDAVEGVTALEIQYYVLIDMQGFADLIDALGGVTIEVEERLPIGSNTLPDGSRAPPAGYIEAGVQEMDGETALWFARTRYGTTDYERMERQRIVQEAILRQFEPANVITKFQSIAEAGAQVVRTDIPQGMLGRFVELGEKTREQELVALELVPPEFDPAAPDFDYIRSQIQQTIERSSPTPEP